MSDTWIILFAQLFGQYGDTIKQWGAFQQRPGTNCKSIGGAAYRNTGPNVLRVDASQACFCKIHAHIIAV